MSRKVVGGRAKPGHDTVWSVWCPHYFSAYGSTSLGTRRNRAPGVKGADAATAVALVHAKTPSIIGSRRLSP